MALPFTNDLQKARETLPSIESRPDPGADFRRAGADRSLLAEHGQQLSAKAFVE